eukprot:RCo050880
MDQVEDSEILFDMSAEKFELRRGEFEIRSIDNIEDTRGHSGQKGRLLVTNLRIIWSSQKNPRDNTSIGHNCVTSIDIRKTYSRLRGQTEAVFVDTQFNSSTFEFIYTDLEHIVSTSTRLFTTVQAVHRCYDSSRMYRDVKMRDEAITREKELIVLPKEQVSLSPPPPPPSTATPYISSWTATATVALRRWM